MKTKISKSLIYLLVFVLSYVFVAYSIGYYIIDDIILSVASQNIEMVCILFRIGLSLLFTWLIQRVINGTQSFSKNELRIFLLAYYIFIISLSLKPVDRYSINFNFLNLVTDFNYSKYSGLLLIGNIAMYIPVGFCIQTLYFHMKFYYKSIVFIVFIYIVELIQYIFLLGVCDINDILLNYIGFILGIFVYCSKVKIRINAVIKC